MQLCDLCPGSDFLLSFVVCKCHKTWASCFFSCLLCFNESLLAILITDRVVEMQIPSGFQKTWEFLICSLSALPGIQIEQLFSEILTATFCSLKRDNVGFDFILGAFNCSSFQYSSFLIILKLLNVLLVIIVKVCFRSLFIPFSIEVHSMPSLCILSPTRLVSFSPPFASFGSINKKHTIHFLLFTW